ncbi:isoleucine-tRNA ligase [Agyrium rufum]|nr:isoleucine-tRNA ligase [Agyrium rufum]
MSIIWKRAKHISSSPLPKSPVSPGSWSKSLNLPKTAFPARPILEEQQQLLAKCTDRLYRFQQKFAQGPLFVLQDGPPYANGSLHIGHALNKILKDITCRHRLNTGQRVVFRPGWDCHGLPIELKAMQQAGAAKQSLPKENKSAVETRVIARELAARAVEEQRETFKSWAIMADWDNAWTTMDRDYELKQMEVFRRMVAKGLICHKKKPVHWSPSSMTALAEAEIEYHDDHISRAAFVKFSIVGRDSGATAAVEGFDWANVSAVIWTTTPWTLPANRAIAFNSDMTYLVIKTKKHGLLLVAESRVSHLQELLEGEDVLVTSSRVFQGSELSGLTYMHPLRASSISHPLLSASFVSDQSGSGLVHIAPGHGSDDYKLGLAHGLEPFAPVDDRGCYTDEAYPEQPDALSGQAVLNEGNDSVLALLKAQNAIVAVHEYRHKYPYDWRSKTPLIERATGQWFADISNIRDDALKAIEDVKFVPVSGKERLLSFVRGRTEWCISRQRAWGLPIPALYHCETGKPLLTDSSVAHIASVIEDRGVDAWWTDDEFDPAWIPASLLDGHSTPQYRRGRDTLDVWFDSGTSWTQMSTNGEHQVPQPADIYLEGTDQHRGWFQSSLLIYIATQSPVDNSRSLPTAPYKTLVTHGFTLDSTGRKMSKSEGNVISPGEIMNGSLLPKRSGRTPRSTDFYASMGLDILRWWIASVDYTKDVVVNPEVQGNTYNSLVKLRLTFKFLIGLQKPAFQVPTPVFERLCLADQIALSQIRELSQQVRRHCDEFEYYKAVAAIHYYVNVNLSAFYFETLKDRFYADAIGSKSFKDSVAVCWQIFLQLSHVLYPFVPLFVEECAHHMHQQTGMECAPLGWTNPKWDDRMSGWTSAAVEKDAPILFAINAEIKTVQEKARISKEMGSSLQSYVHLEIDTMGGESAGATEGLLAKYATDLDNLFVVSKVSFGASQELPQDLQESKWHHTHDLDITIEGVKQRITIHVYEPSEEKCSRCWKYIVPQETDLEEPVCNRCLQVLGGIIDEKPALFEDRPKIQEASAACKEQQRAADSKATDKGQKAYNVY